MASHQNVAIASVLVLAAVTACGTTAQSPADEDEDVSVSGKPNYLDQGWSASTREAFQFANEGGRAIPYAWFLAVEQANNRQRFVDPANLRSFGALVDGASEKNPDGLPVGFTRDDDPVTGSWVGLSCAACHTGSFSY